MNYIKILMLYLMMFIISDVSATSSSGNFQTNATLTASCYLRLGNLNLSTNNVVSTSVIYKCSKGVVATLMINKGNSEVYSAREMIGSEGNTDKLKYNMYTDNTAKNIFGDGTGNSNKVVLPESKGNVSIISLFAKKDPDQYVKPDVYKDQLIISVDY